MPADADRFRVLLTRGEAAAGRYRTALEARGDAVLAAALTTVEPADDGGAALRAAVAAPTDWVLLTSAHAVAPFVAAAGGRPIGRLACVGGATAEAAAERGLRVDVVADRPGAAAAAHALLAAAGPRPRVLFPRAADGRDEAVAILRAAGAEVALVCAYRTGRASADQPDVAAALVALRELAIDAVVCFAPSQVDALIALTGVPLLIAPARIAIGATTAAAFAQHGLPAAAIADAPAPAALADAVALARAGRRDTT